jgi:hypothetical protein
VAGFAQALVPKTHLSDIHPRTLPEGVRADMPGAVRAAGRAGTALVFDKRTWHARTGPGPPPAIAFRSQRKKNYGRAGFVGDSVRVCRALVGV